MAVHVSRTKREVTRATKTEGTDRKTTTKRCPWATPVPLRFAGKWVAWTSDGRQIVASGNSSLAVLEAAEKAGYHHFYVDKIPPATKRSERAKP